MSDGWIEAMAIVSAVHEAEFEAAYVEASDPGDGIIFHRGFVRVRVRNPHEEVLLLLALPHDTGQRARVGPGRYWFPAEAWPAVHDIASYHGIRTKMVPSLLMTMELRNTGLLDRLRAALLRRTAVFGPRYPRVMVDEVRSPGTA